MPNEREILGLQTLQLTGLTVTGDLGHRRVKSVFPDLPVPSGDNIEFDYFVPCGTTCLIGEISGNAGTSNTKEAKNKFRKFCRHLELMRRSPDYFSSFMKFNIPDSVQHLFRGIKEIKGFFIAAEYEVYDVEFDKVSEVSVLYKSDWSTVETYARAIGQFSKPYLLQILGVLDEDPGEHDLRLQGESHKLMVTSNKFITKDAPIRADVFTFMASPYDLLSVSEVFRRELIPLVVSDDHSRYQRPLDFNKLQQMRTLVAQQDFMFPNSILVALSPLCSYDHHEMVLRIPMSYGAVSVIDGQHRLFSYASVELNDILRKDARILVTAVKFQSEDENITLKWSAKTFIEINQSQKRISSAHINDIAYSVLQEDYPKALAANVILRLNLRSPVLKGLFRSSHTTLGTYSSATIITHLAKLTNIEIVRQLQASKLSPQRESLKIGYKELFGIDFSHPAEPEVLIDQTVGSVSRYFSLVQKFFEHDWPKNAEPRAESSLRFAKIFAAFVLLFRSFVYEGLTWPQVEAELEAIRRNVLLALGLPSPYVGIVFDSNNSTVPDSTVSVEDGHKFLSENREVPTSILSIRKST